MLLLPIHSKKCEDDIYVAFGDSMDLSLRYLRTSEQTIMWRALLVAMILCVANATCPVSHEDVWACILKNKCVNVYQLHAKSIHRGKSYLQRPFIMAMEGPRYKKLFRDCDTDRNGCIDPSEVHASNSVCQRSCMWRKTMKSMMCHTE